MAVFTFGEYSFQYGLSTVGFVVVDVFVRKRVNTDWMGVSELNGCEFYSIPAQVCID